MSERHPFFDAFKLISQAKECWPSPGLVALPNSSVSTKSHNPMAHLFSEPLLASSFIHFFVLFCFKTLYSCDYFSTTNDRPILKDNHQKRLFMYLFLRKKQSNFKNFVLFGPQLLLKYHDIIFCCCPPKFVIG